MNNDNDINISITYKNKTTNYIHGSSCYKKKAVPILFPTYVYCKCALCITLCRKKGVMLKKKFML